MANDPNQKCDDHNREKHPNPDISVQQKFSHLNSVNENTEADSGLRTSVTGSGEMYLHTGER